MADLETLMVEDETFCDLMMERNFSTETRTKNEFWTQFSLYITNFLKQMVGPWNIGPQLDLDHCSCALQVSRSGVEGGHVFTTMTTLDMVCILQHLAVRMLITGTSSVMQKWHKDLLRIKVIGRYVRSWEVLFWAMKALGSIKHSSQWIKRGKEAETVVVT